MAGLNGMDSGDLDRRVTVQRGTIVADRANDQVMTWADAFKRWAKKLDMNPVQTVGAGQVLRMVDTAWIFRWDTESRSIGPESHRFIWRGTIYEIVGVAETTVGRMDGLRFLCCSRPDLIGERARANG